MDVSPPHSEAEVGPIGPVGETRRDLWFGVALLIGGVTLFLLAFPRLEASQSAQNQPVGLIVFSYIALVVIIVALILIAVNWSLRGKAVPPDRPKTAPPDPASTAPTRPEGR